MNEKTIRLLKEHQHGGLKYRPGSELTLSDKLADWLVAQGVGTTIATAKTPRAALVSPPRRPCCGRSR